MLRDGFARIYALAVRLWSSLTGPRELTPQPGRYPSAPDRRPISKPPTVDQPTTTDTALTQVRPQVRVEDRTPPKKSLPIRPEPPVVLPDRLLTQHNRLRQFRKLLQERAGQLSRIGNSLAQQQDNTTGLYRHPDSHTAEYEGLQRLVHQTRELINQVHQVTADIEFVTDETEEATRELRYMCAQIESKIDRLPVTPPARVQPGALLLMHQRSWVAISKDKIEQVIELPSELLLGERQSIDWRGQQVQLTPLVALLPQVRGQEAIERPGQPGAVIVLRHDEAWLAIRVEGIFSGRQIAVETLQSPTSRPIGIAGTVMLPSGHSLPVLDVGELFRLAAHQPVSVAPSVPDPVAPVAGPPIILIVDDSMTVREMLTMTLTRADYRVEQARDGQEALDRLRSGLYCDVILCDLEMPRMNGFEFLTHLRGDAVLGHLPVAMLTMRSAEKHRQTAYELGAQAYFTKPYQEDELLLGTSRLLKSRVG